MQEVAFRYAVDRINSNRNVLPRSRLTSATERLAVDDSFLASKKVCQLFRNGVAAIFGSSSLATSSHIQSMCEAVKVPHVQTLLDVDATASDMAVNLHPSPASLSRVPTATIIQSNTSNTIEINHDFCFKGLLGRCARLELEIVHRIIRR